MRDLIIAIEAHHQKCYHLGFGKHVTRSNLSKANTNRDYRIFEEFAYYLVSEALLRMLSEYRFTLPSVPTASLPLCSMICDWIETLMRCCKSSACHSLTQHISKISSTKLYSKMTKTEAVQVNLIYLFFNSSIFSGH